MPVAIVTGANRGLGFAAAEALARKNYEVIFTARKLQDLEKKLEPLRKEGLKVQAMELDISSQKSILQFSKNIMMKYSSLKVLVNNAGIFIDEGDQEISKKLSETFQTNTIGPFLLTTSLWSLLQKSESACVVNVSSGMGQLSEMNGGSPSYRISKTALNAVTKIFASQGEGKILVNSISPGWVKTDMGGAGATRTLEEGIFGIIWAATLPQDGPTGGFFRDGKKLDW